MTRHDDAARARDELGKLRAVKVAAEAVADRLEQRGTVYAADAVTAMLRLALGRGPDPMGRGGQVNETTAQRLAREVADLLADRFPEAMNWAVTTDTERGDDGCLRDHVTICLDVARAAAPPTETRARPLLHAVTCTTSTCDPSCPHVPPVRYRPDPDRPGRGQFEQLTKDGAWWPLQYVSRWQRDDVSDPMEDK